MTVVPADALAALPGTRAARADRAGAEADAGAVLVVLEGALLRRVAGRVERYGPGEIVGLSLAETDDPRPRAVESEGPGRWLEVPVGAVRALAPDHPARAALWGAALRRAEALEVDLAEARAHATAATRRAEVDAGTGARSRAWLDDALPRLVSRVTPDRPLSLVLVDVDRLKAINDADGHLAGDRALAGVARALRARVRPADPIARFGGDEFVVLLPGAGARAALAAAERAREAVAASVPGVTVSCGVASAAPGESPGALLDRADRALYHAKGEGRDRVSSAGDLSE